MSLSWHFPAVGDRSDYGFTPETDMLGTGEPGPPESEREGIKIIDLTPKAKERRAPNLLETFAA